LGQIFRLEKSLLPFTLTGERFTTAAGGQIEVEHLHRYFVAREFCKGKDVLDVASGEGYGTALLGQTAKSAVGIEIDIQSVAHANRSYSRPNVNFIAGDACKIAAQDSSFDIVVSFETLEHIEGQEEFLAEVRRVLRPDGALIISTPDRDVYSAPGQPVNPFHVSELTRDQFKTLLEQSFQYVSVCAQRPFIGSAIIPDSGRFDARPLLTFERRNNSHIEREIGLPRARYLLGFASKQPRESFISASLYIESDQIDAPLQTIQREFLVEIFAHGETGYSQARSLALRAELGKRQTLSFPLPGGFGSGPFRIDPADCPGIIELHQIAVKDAESGQTIWSATRNAELRSLTVSGTLGFLPSHDDCLLFSYGPDPQIILPPIPETGNGVQILIELRIDPDLSRVLSDYAARLPTTETLREQRGTATPQLEQSPQEARHTFESELMKCKGEAGVLNHRVNTLTDEVAALSRTRDKQQTKLYLLERLAEREKNTGAEQYKQLEDSLAERENALAERENSLVAREGSLAEWEGSLAERENSLAERESLRVEQENSLAALKADYSRLSVEHEETKRTMSRVLESQSWRLTAPLRAIFEAVRNRRR
jgi:SAM-dependent methyltransferase